MHLVQISDQLYQQAQQRASAAGFGSVDEYITEIVAIDVSASPENYDHFFTSEIIANLNQVQAQVQAGAKTYTQSEVDEHFRLKSEKWRESHAN